MATNRQLYTYISALLAVSWTIQVVAILVTGDANSDAARVWLAGTMLSPLIVTIIFLNRNKELRKWLLWKPNAKIFITSFLAVLIPIIIAFAVLIIIQQFNFGQSAWFSLSDSGVQISGGPFFLGKGDQSWLVFVLNIFLTGAAFALLNAFFATGEEFAWRGLLQPLLTDKFGLVKGVAILGCIWAIWHLPVLLNGYNYPEHPVIGAFLFFPIRLIAISYFYAWLTLKSRSFIPAAIAHGAGNGIQEGIVSNITMRNGQIYEYMITILVTVLVGLIFLALTIRKEKMRIPGRKGNS
jgi:membrane protease YdiL (CAAX protease family)